MNTTKKRGDHARKRKFPGIKGRRPDRKSIRQGAAITRSIAAELIAEERAAR